MNKEEIEELEEVNVDINDIDELAWGLEVLSKKSNMVIEEFSKLILNLQQENKDLKEEIKKLQRIVISKQEDYLIISVGEITKVFKLNDNKKWVNEVGDNNEK